MQHISGLYFQRRQAWRSGVALRLRLLAQWCQSHALLSPTNAARMADIQKRLVSDSVAIAFVGEMGRGKSELINAIFFGTYKCRVLPVGPGHVTLCPIEISHEKNQASCLRLLAAEPVIDPLAIRNGQGDPLAWTQLDLAPGDADQMAHAMDCISQRVTPSGAPSPAAQSPRWRHAVMNIPLAVLDQGLRIFDTPGVNAPGVGSQPTADLLPLCEVIAFVLSADTGLTACELAMWQNHLVHHAGAGREFLVILNKADALWDPLTETMAVEQQLHQQRLDVAAVLGIDAEKVFTVSAQKGFAAKVSGDAALLTRSGLPVLEEALATTLFFNRQSLWRRNLENAFACMKTDIEDLLSARGREIARKREHVMALVQASTESTSYLPHAAPAPDTEWDHHHAKIKAIQSILHKQMRKIGLALQVPALQGSVRRLELALASSTGLGSVQKAYADFLQDVRKQWEPVAACADDIDEMLASALPPVIADRVDGLRTPPAVQIALYDTQLNRAIAGHLQFLGNSQLHRLKQADFTRHLGTELRSRVGEICRQMQIDCDDWYGQIDAYLRRVIDERRSTAKRHLDLGMLAADKTRQQQAELHAQEADLRHLFVVLNEHFMNLQEANADY